MDIDTDNEEEQKDEWYEEKGIKLINIGKHFNKADTTHKFLHFQYRIHAPTYNLKFNNELIKSRYTTDKWEPKLTTQYQFSKDFKTALTIIPFNPKGAYADLWAKYQINVHMNPLRNPSQRSCLQTHVVRNTLREFNYKIDIQTEKTKERYYRWCVSINRQWNHTWFKEYIPLQCSRISLTFKDWNAQIKLINSNTTKHDWKLLSQLKLNAQYKKQHGMSADWQIQSPKKNHIIGLNFHKSFGQQPFIYTIQYLVQFLSNYRIGLQLQSRNNFQLIFQGRPDYRKLNAAISNRNIFLKYSHKYQIINAQIHCQVKWRQLSIPLIGLRLNFNS